MRVVVRAEEEGINRGTRLDCINDIEIACQQFNIDPADMLAADKFTFYHDFIGIQDNMDRKDNLVRRFIPRLAK